MELSDYDLLGITRKASFRNVKNAYYELSKIYHPDSAQIIIGMSKEERIIAFQRIQQAYENIKNKMNISEIDLPKIEMDYNSENIDIPKISKNDELLNVEKTELNKKFNEMFEKIYSTENKDNPFSIYYEEPEESNRNLQDSKIILKNLNDCKSTNVQEFGVNYIEDHSSEKYLDIRKINEINLSTDNFKSKKESHDNNLDNKLNELIELRQQKIEMNSDELSFITRQNNIQNEIQESKNKIHNERYKNNLLI